MTLRWITAGRRSRSELVFVGSTSARAQISARGPSESARFWQQDRAAGQILVCRANRAFRSSSQKSCADIGRWQVLLDFHNRTFRLLLFGGAALAIEPFWIAANVVLVRKAGAAETGEDLRVWFEEVLVYTSEALRV